MEKKNYLLAIAFLVLFIQLYYIEGKSLKSEEKQCELFFYYDHGTEMCEYCGDICDYSERKGTEEECMTSCSDYLTAKSCTPEQYYDEQVMNCSPCAELCEHQEARGTVEQCNYNKCQGYTTKVNLGTSPETTPPLAESEKTSPHSEGHHLTSQSNITLIVLLTVFAAVTLTLVAVTIYCMKTRLMPYTRAPQKDDGSVDGLDVIKYGQQEHGQPAAAETQPGEREELVVNTRGGI